ncbi:hypothetical protein B0H63DRAFT_529816 [Podospora didyma]|uniref:Uncharacterized protein n=1 Tax=Podospora didyma TaxID=330526 RepID=A0AAE0N186_9PEZI|nr:hypothetical protein B0H63DRAFT_529816 [Podospora didyma]
MEWVIKVDLPLSRGTQYIIFAFSPGWKYPVQPLSNTTWTPLTVHLHPSEVGVHRLDDSPHPYHTFQPITPICWRWYHQYIMGPNLAFILADFDIPSWSTVLAAVTIPTIFSRRPCRKGVDEGQFLWIRASLIEIDLCMSLDQKPTTPPIRVDFNGHEEIIVTTPPSPQPSRWKKPTATILYVIALLTFAIKAQLLAFSRDYEVSQIPLAQNIYNLTVSHYAETVFRVRDPIAIPQLSTFELFLPHAHLADMATVMRAVTHPNLTHHCKEWIKLYSLIEAWRLGFDAAHPSLKHVSALVTDWELIPLGPMASNGSKNYHDNNVSQTVIDIAMSTKRRMEDWKKSSLETTIKGFALLIPEMHRMKETMELIKDEFIMELLPSLPQGYDFYCRLLLQWIRVVEETHQQLVELVEHHLTLQIDAMTKLVEQNKEAYYVYKFDDVNTMIAEVKRGIEKDSQY